MTAHNVSAGIGVRWFQVLEIEPPTYNRLSSERLDGREITKYVLENLEEGTLDRAVGLIQALLEHNPHLCPVFPVNSIEDVRARLQKNPYLTINGHAVCLSNERSANRRDYSDRYFTEGFLKHPVRCSQGHLFEQKRARSWAEQRGGSCPVDPAHSIGDLREIEELAREIVMFRGAERDRRSQDEIIIQRQQVQAMEILIHQNQAAAPRNIAPGEVGLLISDGAKIAVGVNVARKVAKTVTKKAATEGVKKGAKPLVKLVPGVSLAWGVSAGVYRLTQGQRWRAVGEVASGAAACFPGMGTAISVGLDIVIVGGDIHEAVSQENVQVDPHDALLRAYKLLGIETVQNPEPSRDDVERAYRGQMHIIHPDSLQAFGEAYVGQAHILAENVGAARDLIFAQRGWK
jgi:hypothetical protein